MHRLGFTASSTARKTGHLSPPKSRVRITSGLPQSSRPLIPAPAGATVRGQALGVRSTVDWTCRRCLQGRVGRPGPTVGEPRHRSAHDLPADQLHLLIRGQKQVIEGLELQDLHGSPPASDRQAGIFAQLACGCHRAAQPGFHSCPSSGDCASIRRRRSRWCASPKRNSENGGSWGCWAESSLETVPRWEISQKAS
jgi:hypothetical protein